MTLYDSDSKNVPGWRWEGTGEKKGTYWTAVMRAVSKMLKSVGKKFKYGKEISSNDIGDKNEIERVVRQLTNGHGQLTGGHGSKKGMKVSEELCRNGKSGLEDRVICIMGVIGILKMSKKFVLNKAVKKVFDTCESSILNSVTDSRSSLNSILTCEMPQPNRTQAINAVLESLHVLRQNAETLKLLSSVHVLRQTPETLLKLSSFVKGKPPMFLHDDLMKKKYKDKLFVRTRDEVLKNQGLKIKVSDPDGHCLYHSIVGQIEMKNVERPDTLKDVEDYVLLRHLCASYMEENESRFKIVCKGVDGNNKLKFDAYIKRVRGNMWGGYPEIVALSGKLNRKFEIWTLNFDSGEVKLKKIDIEDGKKNEGDAEEKSDGELNGTSNDPIRLLYNGLHYDALVLVETKEEGKKKEKEAEQKEEVFQDVSLDQSSTSNIMDTNSSNEEVSCNKLLKQADEMFKNNLIDQEEYREVKFIVYTSYFEHVLMQKGIEETLKSIEHKFTKGSQSSKECDGKKGLDSMKKRLRKIILETHFKPGKP